jgi:signal transduction histidine kinase
MRTIILLFFVISLNAYAQKSGQAFIDSVLIEISKTQEDTLKVNQLNEIAATYQAIDLIKTLSYANQALQLSNNINWKDGVANSYKNIGNYYIGKSDLKNALKSYENGLVAAESKKIKAKLLMGLGVVCFRQSDYPKALSYYNTALNTFEAINDKKNCLKILRNTAMIYIQLEAFQKAIDTYNKYLKLNETVNFIDYDGSIMHELGICYSNLNQLDTATVYLNKALLIAEATDNNLIRAAAINSLGSVMFKRKKMMEAIHYFEQSLILFQELEEYVNISKSNSSLANCYLQLAKSTSDKNAKSNYLNKSLSYSKKSIALDAENAEKDGLDISYNNMYEALKLQGNYKEALNAFEIASLYKDSIYNLDNKETIKNLEDKRTIELKEKEIQLTSIQLENKEKQKWYLMGGIGLLAIVGGLLFYQSRNRRKTNEQLKVLNAHLDQANKVKTRFFNILNHDLRSPVSNLIHFMHLQKESPELLDEENKKRLEIKTMSSAENLLYSMEDILLWSKGQMENFKPILKEIEVKLLFEDTQKHFASEEKVKIVFENKENIKINTDENYLKTIIRNLTGNAIKALANIENSTIVWKVWQENHQKFLSITDNGKGATDAQFKALYDDKEVVGIRTGLGLHLIRDLADAIHCKVEVDSKLNIGTTFILKMA